MTSPAFPDDAPIRRVSAEPGLLLGAGRALLLQIAHPSVAAGVAEHSDFKANPFKRLVGTLEATYAMVYGSVELADGVGRRIRWIHDHVVGPTYRANDPANLLWVHATLLDTALGLYERLCGPLAPDDLDRYYEELSTVAERFGCPRSEQPATIAEFRSYFDAQVSALEVTGTGRALAADILRPRLPWRLDIPLAPALALQRFVTIGLLPAPLRDQFGLAWSEAQERRLRRVLGAVAAVYRRVPTPLRTAPVRAYVRALLRLAQRHVAEFDAKHGAAAARS